MSASVRSLVVRPGVPGIFHCVSSCCRQLPLMGWRDGRDFDYRRLWFIDRLDWLSDAFAVSVLWFAVMGNHLHLVLRAEPQRVKRMSDREVARRWLRAFPGRRVMQGQESEPTAEEVARLLMRKKLIRTLRRRLSCISWFHRALKEPISRRLNREEGRRGTMWQGRFHCREILDEESLLVVGLYNDLNPLRAGEAGLPWESPYCSAGLRRREAAGGPAAPWLANFTLQPGQADDQPARGGRRSSDRGCLNMTLSQYERLLAWAATIPKAGKASLAPEVAALLERLKIKPERLAELLQDLPRVFRRVMGNSQSMARRAKAANRRWFQGAAQADKYFG